MPDLSRIKTAMDVRKLRQAVVVVIGLGGAADMVRNLARCGIRHFRLIDFDRVDESNIARQGHDAASVGQPKVVSVAAQLKAINPAVVVETFDQDVTALSDEDEAHIFADADVVLACTDSFDEARINQLVLKYSVPTFFPVSTRAEWPPRTFGGIRV